MALTMTVGIPTIAFGSEDNPEEPPQTVEEQPGETGGDENEPPVVEKQDQIISFSDEIENASDHERHKGGLGRGDLLCQREHFLIRQGKGQRSILNKGDDLICH